MQKVSQQSKSMSSQYLVISRQFLYVESALIYIFLWYFPVDLQQTSPSPVCPSDDVILTCTVTAPTNQPELLFFHFYNAFDEEDRLFYDAEVDTNIVNNWTVGPFTTKIVEISNDSIPATATIKGITYAGIICKDGPGDENVLYIAIGKKKITGYKLISL